MKIPEKIPEFFFLLFLSFFSRQDRLIFVFVGMQHDLGLNRFLL